ncbi:MAG TPA: hypothetical protein VMS56_15915 [Thermoanaerobaculia bacterium]|nr:hypothetical protein [Thermoanaerobaculia bacterium]
MGVPRVRLAAGLFAALLLAGCGRHEISRAEWEALEPREKELVVESLRGGEAAAEAKGSAPRSWSRPTGEYVGEIDARYAAGDPRSVNEIWRELADRGGGTSTP